jgi:hypothetical protein
METETSFLQNSRSQLHILKKKNKKRRGRRRRRKKE